MTSRHEDTPTCGLTPDSADDMRSSPPGTPTIGEVAAARMGRRSFLKGALGTTAYAALGTGTASMLAACSDEGEEKLVAGHGTMPEPGSLAQFPEIAHGVDETHHVANGYDADILLRWGDALFPDAPAFRPGVPDPDAQERQFGYNNDYVGFIPLENSGGKRALLCVNHEYTSRRMMFPRDMLFTPSKEVAETEMAAHGGSIVEIRKGDNGKWQVVTDSPYNRRITTRSTEMEIRGPAAGHDRLKTSADPTGTRVIGTLNNCAGGITPWGTYLMAEENFNFYFTGEIRDREGNAIPRAELFYACMTGNVSGREARSLCRYGFGYGGYDWGDFFDRFNFEKEPHEPNRFGWIVEVDPLDPASTPVKHTALGRFKHEGAETIINKDGRIVIYSGDDQRFDYLYRFVSNGTVSSDREANKRLLDDGVLSVAKFNADGTVTWMPIVYGEGPLTEENDFHSQGDVLIETRRAADILGATPMDRPEDVQPNPQTGKVYVALTNNSKRTANQTDAVHARAENHWGLIVELTPIDSDHAAETCRWDILVQAGPPAPLKTEYPADPEEAARLDEYSSIPYADPKSTWNPATSESGWFSCPDNLAVDPFGRLWVATDQGSAWPNTSGTADGIWALGTDGEARAQGAMFFRVPVGAEMCGPCFDDKGDTLFVAVQHPGTDGVLEYHGRASYFDDPMTRWPDFEEGRPPRPSVVAITKTGGGHIG